MAESLSDYAGTYVGIAPTDESAIGTGEVEVTVGDGGASFRYATGLGVDTLTVDAEEVSVVPPEAVSELFELEDPKKTTPAIKKAIRAGERTLLFVQAQGKDIELAVVGGPEDLIGPTRLFGPDQVARGLHEQAILRIESMLGQPGDIPRLSNGGLAPNAQTA